MVNRTGETCGSVRIREKMRLRLEKRGKITRVRICYERRRDCKRKKKGDIKRCIYSPSKDEAREQFGREINQNVSWNRKLIIRR